MTSNVGETMTVNPKSLANLLPPCKPGETRIPPDKRHVAPPNAGASLISWANQMATWDREKIQEVIDNKRSPAIKVSAAYRTLAQLANDEMAVRNAGLMLEHTNGKAIQRIQQEVTVRATNPLEERIAALTDEQWTRFVTWLDATAPPTQIPQSPGVLTIDAVVEPVAEPVAAELAVEPVVAQIVEPELEPEQAPDIERPVVAIPAIAEMVVAESAAIPAVSDIEPGDDRAAASLGIAPE